MKKDLIGILLYISIPINIILSILTLCMNVGSIIEIYNCSVYLNLLFALISYVYHIVEYQKIISFKIVLISMYYLISILLLMILVDISGYGPSWQFN